MFTALLDILLSRRDMIVDKLELLMKNQKDLLRDIGWKSFSSGKNLDLLVAAVDGSMNYKQYKGFMIYAVDSESVLIEDGKVSVFRQLGDVDVLVPFWLPEERIKLYMSILEIKNAIQVLSEKDDMLVLLDGSLSGLVIRPIKYSYTGLEVNHIVKKKYLDILIDEIERKNGGIISKNYTPQIFEEFKDTYSIEDAQAACFYLEYLEYLVSLMYLFSNFSERIIGIAKNSEDRSIFRYAISDIAYLDMNIKSPGYVLSSKNIELKNMKRGLPVFWDFFRKLEFQVLYVKFSENGPILKMEIPYALREYSIEDILKTLDNTCIDGYPYPLTIAHRDVKITNKDMETITKMLGIYWAKTGREML